MVDKGKIFFGQDRTGQDRPRPGVYLDIHQMGNDIEIIWIPIKSRDALNDKEIEEA